MAHDNPESHTICTHEGCICVVDKDQGIQEGDQYYCCQGCADGVGCNNDHCNCANTAKAQPVINPPQ